MIARQTLARKWRDVPRHALPHVLTCYRVSGFDSNMRIGDDAVETATNLPLACSVIWAGLPPGHCWSVASMTYAHTDNSAATGGSSGCVFHVETRAVALVCPVD